jgi:hypothetical protein
MSQRTMDPLLNGMPITQVDDDQMGTLLLDRSDSLSTLVMCRPSPADDVLPVSDHGPQPGLDVAVP